jgi:hypothetical protein
MFLRYFVELPLPARRVEDALLGSPATWLPRAPSFGEFGWLER